MSEKEVRTVGILARVKAGDLTQVEAAEMLGLCYRQTKRLYRRFVELGRMAWYTATRGSDPTTAKPRSFATAFWIW